MLVMPENYKVILEKWSDFPAIKKLHKEESDRFNLSVLFESIDRISMPPSDGMETFYEENKKFLVAKIYSRLIFPKIIGFQTIIGQNGLIYYQNNIPPGNPKNTIGKIVGGIDATDCVLAKENLDVFISREELNKIEKIQKDIESIDSLKDLAKNLNIKKNYLDGIASAIAAKIDRKVLDKIANNCGTKKSLDFAKLLGETIKEKWESLYVEMVKTGNEIRDKSFAPFVANFVVTSPEIASVFEDACHGLTSVPPLYMPSATDIQHIGTVCHRWRVYTDPKMSVKRIILGYHGMKSMDQGLFFTANNLFEISDKSADSDKFQTAMNYDLRFVPNGESYYGTIDIENFII